MKAKIKRTALISALVVASIASCASALSVTDATSPVSQQNVKICKTIDNAKNAPRSYSYEFKAKESGLTGLPKTQTINFEDITDGLTKCIDVDLSSVAFADNTPKQIEVEVTESIINGLGENSTSYSILFDLHETYDKKSNPVGRVVSVFLHDASGAKVNQFDFE